MSTILVFNAGSSSLKWSLIDAGSNEPRGVGIASRVGADDSSLRFSLGERTVDHDQVTYADHRQALRGALDAMDQVDPAWRDEIVGVGHRVVHGGKDFTQPTVINHRTAHVLEDLNELAPLHNGRAIAVVDAARRAFPGVPQIACFDTMFHSGLPPEAAEYALPRRITERHGIRRYGFHGLSCAWSMERLQALQVTPQERVIICHLGAGASVTAVLNGRSIDTSMGFTPLEGLIMATRSGSIDPSIVLYLQRHAGLDAEQIDHMLERESGLCGLSGISGDVQQLEQQAGTGNARAEQALSTFAYRVRAYIGAYFAVLGGLDVLVLTGGIGEHSYDMRLRILEPLGHLGIAPAEEGAEGGAYQVSPRGSGVAVWVIPAEEERVIAGMVSTLLKRQGA